MRVGVLRQSGQNKPHPRPDREVEARARGSGEVVTRSMTAEDWDRYGPLNTDSKRKRNIENLEKKEAVEVKKELTKEIYLQERISGKRNVEIEREYGVKPNKIYNLFAKWGVTTKEVNAYVDEHRKKVPSVPKQDVTKPESVEPTEINSGEVAVQDSPDSFIAATIERDQQIMTRATPKKSGRVLQIETIGITEAIEGELKALCGYVAAMPVKQYRLEISLVEVSGHE